MPPGMACWDCSWGAGAASCAFFSPLHPVKARITAEAVTRKYLLDDPDRLMCLLSSIWCEALWPRFLFSIVLKKGAAQSGHFSKV
jgi:hypothetical protein